MERRADCGESLRSGGQHGRDVASQTFFACRELRDLCFGLETPAAMSTEVQRRVVRAMAMGAASARGAKRVGSQERKIQQVGVGVSKQSKIRLRHRCIAGRSLPRPGATAVGVLMKCLKEEKNRPGYSRTKLRRSWVSC